MLLPIRTNVIPRRRPIANYTLIAINIIIFILSYHPHIVYTPYGRMLEPLRDWAQHFILYSNKPPIWQFVSYAFLHASFAHILGNMFFLYMFGNNVNDRLGNIGYICFYLAGGVAAGIGHTLLSNNPVLGASGAVAAVTGAFLVLYPKAIITVLYWFFFIGTFEVPAIWFIALKLIFIDNVVNPQYHNAPVAYDAHLTGYAFGIITISLLIWTNLIHHNGMNLITMIQQWNRRRVYKEAVNKSYDPFTGLHSKKVYSKVFPTPHDIKKEQSIMALRQEINDLFASSDIPSAAQKYLKLISIDKNQVLQKNHQLDIANHLMSIGSWKNSADAYEKFKLHYPKYEHIEQIKLMLGILYSRYLVKPELAVKNLEEALTGLKDQNQITMCQQELDKNQKDNWNDD